MSDKSDKTIDGEKRSQKGGLPPRRKSAAKKAAPGCVDVKAPGIVVYDNSIKIVRKPGAPESKPFSFVERIEPRTAGQPHIFEAGVTIKEPNPVPVTAQHLVNDSFCGALRQSTIANAVNAVLNSAKPFRPSFVGVVVRDRESGAIVASRTDGKKRESPQTIRSRAKEYVVSSGGDALAVEITLEFQPQQLEGKWKKLLFGPSPDLAGKRTRKRVDAVVRIAQKPSEVDAANFMERAAAAGVDAGFFEHAATRPFAVSVDADSKAMSVLAERFAAERYAVEIDVTDFLVVSSDVFPRVVFLGLFSTGAVVGIRGKLELRKQRVLFRVLNPFSLFEPSASERLDDAPSSTTVEVIGIEGESI